MVEHSVWLSFVKNLTKKKKTSLLEAFGDSEAVYMAAQEELLRAVPALSEKDLKELSDKGLNPAFRVLEACRGCGAEVIDYNNNSYPYRLRNIADPPVVLYVRGCMPDFKGSIALGVVGQRKATATGLRNASKLAYELSRNGLIIVSGMAAGIDSYAHRGALDGGSPTIAVLGTAIDKCYPASNASLMRQIISGGAVLSEYPPGYKTLPGNFLSRNRIISGICRGVLVIEAREKSGSLVTAKRACDQNRDVFAVPGPIDSEDYVGTNGLIKDGAAIVTSSEDILSAYGAEVIAASVNQKQKNIGGKAKIVEPTGPDSDILKAIGKISHIDDIIERLGREPGEVMASLTLL
ncbi:MAG: DNA-processing protein DprA, partial [Clostridiaceae bacterium]|nr:DNA-processing protein DprA [Clostridiaceae bacterium]